MNSLRRVFHKRWQALPFLMIAALLGVSLMSTSPASANHPVLVEGNCDSPVPGTTIVSPNTCGDYDGDGRIGTAEDTDGADRIFGTLSAAIGPGTGAAAGTGANFNGSITIVRSGRFAEATQVVNPGGNIEISAAPGVEAIIDAVLQGDPAGGNIDRQNGVAFLFSTPSDRRVILRNLTIRNWNEGIRATQAARISVIGCHIYNNRDFGIRATDSSRVAVYRSEINATGFRLGSGVTNTTQFGHGILFEANAGGTVAQSLIAGSLRNAILNVSSLGAAGVRYYEVIIESNGTDAITNATRVTEP
ncbi:MAG TPA: right-handed parallel beta-helix repeat-containing protein [Pyrinomonadaceae bacterium]|nr:right-handed parallel beta-helix repeat-containing protein [Pyrinomonadaceae bacterium]